MAHVDVIQHEIEIYIYVVNNEKVLLLLLLFINIDGKLFLILKIITAINY